MAQTETGQRDHWYRHRWPWVLMLVPFAAVLFGMVMVGTAVFFPDDVVVDTYYRDGQGINRLLALDDSATALGLEASLQTGNETESETSLSLRGTAGPVSEAALELSVFHVIDSSQDREYRLLPAATPGTYFSRDETLASIFASRGIWYLELRDQNGEWRLRQRIQTPITELTF